MNRVVRVDPSEIRGTISAPSSKSYAQRAVAAALLTEGTVTIENLSLCDDTASSLRVAERLGARTRDREDCLVVQGGLRPVEGSLDCGESGLCMRMFTPIASLTGRHCQLVARGSLRSRRMGAIEKPLKELGVRCSTSRGRPPLEVRGPLRGGETELDSSVTSQFLTGLLMALPGAEKDSVVRVRNLSSRPYVKMTLDVLDRFGIECEWDSSDVFRIPAQQRYRPRRLRAEGDWSGAAFPLVAGAAAGSVTVTGLNSASLQADLLILDALRLAGAEVTLENDACTVARRDLKPFEFDVSQCPDLAPPLAALAAYCGGDSRIWGISRLAFKESDRAGVLQEEFGRIGVNIRIESDCMIVRGSRPTGGSASARGDHRIAMALATAALRAKDCVRIHGADSVGKSYPRFFDDVRKLGAECHE